MSFHVRTILDILSCKELYLILFKVDDIHLTIRQKIPRLIRYCSYEFTIRIGFTSGQIARERHEYKD